MSLEEVQLLKDGTGVAVPPRGEFAEWPNMEKENDTAYEKDKGTANGGSTTVSGDGKVIRQMVVPTPRTLTSVEIAWGKARGYKWAADAEAAQKQTWEPDAQSPSDSTSASQAGYGDWSGDPYYGSHYGYGDWSGDPYYGSHADGYYSYGDWSGDASQCGGGNGYYGYGDWSGDASQSGGGNGYYSYGDWSGDASQRGGGNSYYGYGYGDGSWDASQSGAEHEQKDSTAEKTEKTKEEVKNAKKEEEVDPEAEKTEETKEEVKNAKKEEEEVNPEAEKTEKIKDVENAKKEEEEVNPEAEKTEKIKDVKNAKKEEEVNPEAEKTEKIKDVENVKEEEVNTEAEKTERIKDVENAKKEVEVARQENEDFLQKRFYFGIGDFEGVMLPEKLDDLALLLKDRNYVTSDDVWYFYYNAIKDEEYLEVLVDEARKHPCLAGFEASVRESHGLLEWSFGCDGEATYVEDLAEMTHYLQIQHEAEVAQKFNKENKFNTEEFDKVAKGLDFGFGELDKNHRKEKGTTQKPKDIKTEKVTAPLTRVRTKGQPKRKSLSEDEEAWVVKWAPVTKTGIVDFAQNCLGHPVSSAQKPPVFANTSVENLDYMNTSSITWQPIKPGETIYLLNHFFRQVNPKDMALGQFIEYCKDIDWNCVNPFPDGTPKAVRSTMVAVNDMWEEYRTDNPDEVQWWLTNW